MRGRYVATIKEGNRRRSHRMLAKSKKRSHKGCQGGVGEEERRRGGEEEEALCSRTATCLVMYMAMNFVCIAMYLAVYITSHFIMCIVSYIVVLCRWQQLRLALWRIRRSRI